MFEEWHQIVTARCHFATKQKKIQSITTSNPSTFTLSKNYSTGKYTLTYTVESAFKSLICPREKTTYNRKRLVSKFNPFPPSLTFFHESLQIWFSDLAILCRVRLTVLLSLMILSFLSPFFRRSKILRLSSIVRCVRFPGGFSDSVLQWTVTELWLTDCD